VEKNRKIFADRAKALSQHLLGGCADDYIIAVGTRPT
jgi:hypothetical protein